MSTNFKKTLQSVTTLGLIVTGINLFIPSDSKAEWCLFGAEDSATKFRKCVNREDDTRTATEDTCYRNSKDYNRNEAIDTDKGLKAYDWEFRELFRGKPEECKTWCQSGSKGEAGCFNGDKWGYNY